MRYVSTYFELRGKDIEDIRKIIIEIEINEKIKIFIEQEAKETRLNVKADFKIGEKIKIGKMMYFSKYTKEFQEVMIPCEIIGNDYLLLNRGEDWDDEDSETMNLCHIVRVQINDIKELKENIQFAFRELKCKNGL